MDQQPAYRGPLSFTVAESKVAVGLAVVVLLFSVLAVYQRLIKPAPQYAFRTCVMEPVAHPGLPGPNVGVLPADDQEPPPPAADPKFLDINTADYADLLRLPGIGPVLAGRIMEYRDRHGPFIAIDSLVNVSGIGPGKLEKIRPLATVR